jgi:peroxiredoxin
MWTTDVKRMRKWLILLFSSILIFVFLGGIAWVAAPSSIPAASPPTVAKVPQETGKHFNGKIHFDLLAKLLADDRRSAPANEWLRELADPKAPFQVASQSHPLLDRPAPDFTLNDHRGQAWSLQGQLERGPVVLVFYLGYSCNFCVHDLFELNADIERFHSLGAEVIAVSGDSPDLTRQQFDRYGAFGFPVLTDPDHVVGRSYGMVRPAKASEPEELLHGTFLVGRDGQVHWVSSGDTPFHNNKALLYEVARLENKLPQPEPAPPGDEKQLQTP